MSRSFPALWVTDLPEFFPDYIKFTRQFSQLTPSFLEFREIICMVSQRKMILWEAFSSSSGRPSREITRQWRRNEELGARGRFSKVSITFRVRNQIEIKRIKARVLASKILHFVSLTDSFIVLDAKLLKPLSCLWKTTALRDFREMGPRPPHPALQSCTQCPLILS